ncbi:MAG: biopolymer transporter ExbD [Methylococcaceae bacterium]|nr:MAG: biopolymer transporter ExbD [Methylococcaceae bacterium]
MNFRRRGRGRDTLELNVTSMIDVLLILLIFFILTTSFSHETRLSVNLPQAGGGPPEQDKTLTVTIDAEGRYSIDHHALTDARLDTLKLALQSAAAGNTSQTVLIGADAKTPHQAVMTALEAASRSGLTRISFAAEAPP